MSVSEYVTNSLLKFETPVLVENLNATRKRKVQPVEPNPNQETIDFLDTLLPPRTVIDGPMEFRLHASAIQTSRLDVIKLEEQLDHLLKERKARDKGKVPVPIPGDKQHTTIMVKRGRSKQKAIENFLRKTKQPKQ